MFYKFVLQAVVGMGVGMGHGYECHSPGSLDVPEPERNDSVKKTT